jgi:3-phenylpropionate/trans-cinnamate dioxygenase ferredoxin subunit
MRKVKAANVSELPPGSMMGLEIEEKRILLANVQGMFYAMEGLCSHMAGRLWEGTLEGYIVKCPKHGSRFDLRTGEVVSQVRIPLIGKAKPLGVYKTSVDGEDVMVEI